MGSGASIAVEQGALPPVCILAGGLGTRLGERVRDTPKPLLELAGEPFLVHQLRLLAGCGAREVVLCVGYRGDLIQARLGAEAFGIQLDYSFDGPDLDGTLGALRRALPLLDQRFLVLNGDTYLRMDYRAAVSAWCASGLPAMMTVLHNRGRWDRSNVNYVDGRVTAYDKRSPGARMEWVDCGVLGLRQDTVEKAPRNMRDLADLARCLAAEGLLCGHEVSERYYEMGTPGSLLETEAFLSQVAAASDGKPQGAGQLSGRGRSDV